MVTEKISNLLSDYFDLAFAEGKEGRNHDTEAGDAQRVLSELESAISEASERAMLHSADAKTAWAECEALRVRVAELEAALSTDAEPLAWKGVGSDGVSDLTDRQDIADQWLADGIEVTPFYAAPPAPSVAVKALADAYQKYLDAVSLYNERHAVMKTKALGTMRVDEEYKAIDVARRAFDKLAVEVATSALSAQVQDVAVPDDMSLPVALSFADEPRPYHSLRAPADTNSELYEALRVLAKAYRSAAPAAKLEEKP